LGKMTAAPDITRIALDSLGCKLNQAEIEQLAREFNGAGCRLVTDVAEADIYILNTCTVTGVADRKSRQRLRLAHRRNPDARLVATGCYAERAPQELAGIEGVALVVGNERKLRLRRLLEEAGYLPSSGRAQPAESFTVTGRTRAFIRIQDGCRQNCAYCVVPLVRRRESCVPAEQVVAQVGQRVAAGYREVVLTGTEVGAYRHGAVGLAELLQEILAATAVSRLRLSSLQPPEITPELLALWQDPRLCPHFHLSLQSGSDAVLRRMKRRYTAASFRRAVGLIRQAVPEAAVTTDIIVGFPGETGEEHEESIAFCRQAGFARIHVFPYSPRPGTAAARLPGVADEVKRLRSRQMLALAGASSQRFRERFVGRALPVLWERRTGGSWCGLTGNYLRVYARDSRELTGLELTARLTGPWRDGLRGETAAPPPPG